jgi:hypothetical protein
MFHACYGNLLVSKDPSFSMTFPATEKANSIMLFEVEEGSVMVVVILLNENVVFAVM